jgi:hypothetical protein
MKLVDLLPLVNTGVLFCVWYWLYRNLRIRDRSRIEFEAKITARLDAADRQREQLLIAAVPEGDSDS